LLEAVANTCFVASPHDCLEAYDVHIFLETVFPEEVMSAKKTANHKLFQVLNVRFGLNKTNTTNRQAVNQLNPSKHEVGHTTEYRNLAFCAPVKNLLDSPGPDATKQEKELHAMVVLIQQHNQNKLCGFQGRI
jgi:hypothetical protein